MTIRYDPLLAAGVAAEIGDRLIGRRVEALFLDEERREARVAFAPQPEDSGQADRSTAGACELVLELHPARGWVLCDTEAYLGPAPGRRVRFRRLQLTAVRAPPDERLLVVELSGGRRDVHTERPPVYRLYVELQTNQWNAVLVRGRDDRIEHVLWPRSAGERALRAGAPYPSPEGARDWADSLPTPEEWRERLAAVAPPDRRRIVLDTVAWTSSINVDWILGDAASIATDEALEAAYERYAALRTASPEAWLLPGSELQPYPAPIREGARRCRSLLEAMRKARPPEAALPGAGARLQPGEAGGRDSEEARVLEQRLRDRVRRLEKRRAALQRQLAGDSAGELRQLANLLLARKNEVARGAASASLTDFDGRQVQVPLDPRLDAIRNADRLYERARRRERAARAIPGRVREVTERIERLEEAIEILHRAGPTESLWNLGGGPLQASGPRASAVAPALPYRTYRSSGGREIRVGRSSRANDDLTFRHSSPEDIWLHARHAAGAHVILRWDRRDANPPLFELTEAAVLAALHSQARHSGIVAVDWTRRKYVRKPRKAPPGSVVPERVSTLFVEPDEAVASRLAEKD